MESMACDGTAIAYRLLAAPFWRCVVKRESSLLAILVFLSATIPLTFAQDVKSQPSPVLPILGPQLIAWSHLQKPQPVPQPLPPPDRPAQQPNQQTDQQPAQSANPSVQPQ